MEEKESKIIENLESGNYEVVDNQGVSVTQHFIECLEKEFTDLEAKLAESEKKHLINEKEWQDYCAFKHIEPQIKGCLDREREYEKQLAEKDKEIEKLNACVKFYKSYYISFNEKVIDELEKVKEWFIRNATNDVNNNAVLLDHSYTGVLMLLDGKIEDLKG